MKKTVLLFLFITQVIWSQYNNPVASQMSSHFIDKADTFCGVDAYEAHYFIRNNTFFKEKNNVFTPYKNVSLGKISRVDIQNPLRLILFYETFNTLIALDNQLNEVQKINFNEEPNNLLITAIATASQNSYWLFDQNNMQIMLYSYLKKNYQKVGSPLQIPIKTYQADFNNFYWVDNTNTFHRMDIKGNYTNIGPIPEYSHVDLYSPQLILYAKDQKIFFYDITKKESILVKDVEKSFISFEYKNQNLAIFTDQGITNYKINLP